MISFGASSPVKSDSTDTEVAIFRYMLNAVITKMYRHITAFHRLTKIFSESSFEDGMGTSASMRATQSPLEPCAHFLAIRMLKQLTQGSRAFPSRTLSMSWQRIRELWSKNYQGRESKNYDQRTIKASKALAFCWGNGTAPCQSRR